MILVWHVEKLNIDQYLHLCIDWIHGFLLKKLQHERQCKYKKNIMLVSQQRLSSPTCWLPPIYGYTSLRYLYYPDSWYISWRISTSKPNNAIVHSYHRITWKSMSFPCKSPLRPPMTFICLFLCRLYCIFWSSINLLLQYNKSYEVINRKKLTLQ